MHNHTNNIIYIYYNINIITYCINRLAAVETELQYASCFHVGWQAALLRCLLVCCCCACMVSGCVACLFAAAVLPWFAAYPLAELGVQPV